MNLSEMVAALVGMFPKCSLSVGVECKSYLSGSTRHDYVEYSICLHNQPKETHHCIFFKGNMPEEAYNKAVAYAAVTNGQCEAFAQADDFVAPSAADSF